MKANSRWCRSRHAAEFARGGKDISIFYPRRQLFFYKVASILLVLGVTVIVIHSLSLDEFSVKRTLHFIFWTGLIVSICVFALRRLLAPMRRLMQGVTAISNGDLDFQFTSAKKDEFCCLADAFNLMVKRIKEMVDSKTQLLLDVSHELRSPLTRIKLALEMSPDNAQKQSIMEDIAEMEAMITELLETERLRSGNGGLSITDTNLHLLISELIDKYQDRKPGIKLLPANSDVWVKADPARTRTALQNVLENALKYSQLSEQAIELKIEQYTDEVLIRIRDYGEGIDKAEQTKIFEPFYRTDKSRNRETGGYGLGLSLCDEIMRAHGGDIELQSWLGEGTQVTLKFPLP